MELNPELIFYGIHSGQRQSGLWRSEVHKIREWKCLLRLLLRHVDSIWPLCSISGEREWERKDMGGQVCVSIRSFIIHQKTRSLKSCTIQDFLCFTDIPRYKYIYIWVYLYMFIVKNITWLHLEQSSLIHAHSTYIIGCIRWRRKQIISKPLRYRC